MRNSAALRRSLLLAALVLAPVLAAAQAKPAQSPEGLAKALQAHYEGIRDFTADFVQSYRGGVLKTQSQEYGTVSVKKPGRMHWVYTKPERKELVSDGAKIYWYVPEDKQVTVSDMPTGDQAATGAMFLSGKGNIVRDFTASVAPSPVSGAVALKLTPRRAQPEYEYLVVAFDPSTHQIRSLTTRDLQGGESTTRFSNMKENRGISDKEFVFRPPRGVNVITDATR
jgi:outer membrane lipoprotein carrier protein